MVIYTIGHSTHSVQEFADLLLSRKVTFLVDVRSKWPMSRHNPQFNKQVMENWLPGDYGIGYEHIPLLGGWRTKRNVDPAINAGWRSQGMHNYADYTLSDDFHQGLTRLLEIAKEQTVAYMCAEILPWRCHRMLISDVLGSQGYEIKHIIGLKETLDYTPGQWGAKPVVTDKGMCYPAAI